MTSILGVITLVLTCAIGIWKMFSRKKAYKRKLADEAKGDLDDAQKNKDVSGRLNAWGKLRRVR